MAKISLSPALEEFLVDEAVKYQYDVLYDRFVFRDILQPDRKFYLRLATVQSQSHTWIKDRSMRH